MQKQESMGNSSHTEILDDGWRVTIGEDDLPDFCPYYTGNGRIGTRVGPLVLDRGGDARPLQAEPGL